VLSGKVYIRTNRLTHYRTKVGFFFIEIDEGCDQRNLEVTINFRSSACAKATARFLLLVQVVVEERLRVNASTREGRGSGARASVHPH
jgi:hypothetical protein